MNELKGQIGNKSLIFNVPACFDEKNRSQFLNSCKYSLGLMDSDDYLLSIIGLEKKIWDELVGFHKYCIRQMLDFVSMETPEIPRQLLPYIEIGDKRYIGYQPNFSNTSWEEFIYADPYMMNDKYRESRRCVIPIAKGELQ